MLNSTHAIPVTAFDFHGTFGQPLHLEFDLSDHVAVQEIPVFLSTQPTDLDRAMQALRDIRHMLPANGVSIVDAVLDGTG